MNYSDAERIRTVLVRSGHKEEKRIKKADLIIFVTCSIKQKAEDKVVGHFRELLRERKKRKDLRIGFTGCMIRITSTKKSERRDRWLNKLKGLDFVFRIEDVEKLPTLLENEETVEQGCQNPIGYFEIKPSYSEKFQAFVPIMNGCNKFCTYCIVPYARGREISRKMSDVVSEIKTLIENGYKEITLLGQNVNSYGRTNNVYDDQLKQNELEPFPRLLSEIDALPGKFWLRFTSPHPQDMSDQTIETICKLRSVCNSVHLPLQSGDNTVLKKMNRSYDVKHFCKIVKKFRDLRPDISISTDAIVGFCGETKKQFENTLKTFRECKFDLAYISQYSERKGTFAQKNLKDNISVTEKRRRFHELNNLLKQISLRRNLSYIGKTLEVLIDSWDKKKMMAFGKTSCNKTVEIQGDLPPIGEFCMVTITGAKEWILEGKRQNAVHRVIRKIYEKSITTSPVKT